MNTPDHEDELTTLARARAGLSPSPADALRVRTSLAAVLAAPAPGNISPDAAASDAGSGLAASGGWSLRVLVTSVAVATMGAGAGGYWLGHRAGSQEAGQEARPEARQEAPRAANHAVGNDSAPPSPPGAGAGPGAPSPVPASPAGDTAGARDLIRRRPGSAARGARPEGIAPAESLGHEVRALRAVERALRDDDPRLALAILQQLDRDVPKGKLVEERRATAVIARCAAGDVPFGVNWAEDFASDYPDSVYRGRVEQSCERRLGK